MKTVKILFEVSEKQTTVVALGSDGKKMSRRDITGTKEEKQFQELLKNIHQLPYQMGVKQ